MKKFRLKKEAVPFINERHATSIYDYECWQSLGIDLKALEEVVPIYIEYGHYGKGGSGTLCGWDEEKAKFCFTINFPRMQHCDYDVLSKGRTTRDLMERIGNTINSFYEDFLSEPHE